MDSVDSKAAPPAPQSAPRPARSRIGVVVDAILFLIALGLGATLLYYSAILPNARRAERLERRAYALEREVDSAAGDVKKLRREVVALQSDPYTIERTLRRRLAALRPDLLEPPPPVPPKPGRRQN